MAWPEVVLILGVLALAVAAWGLAGRRSDVALREAVRALGKAIDGLTERVKLLEARVGEGQGRGRMPLPPHMR